ncbi:thiamine pyrophosphate-dependent enzyme, partial [Klebsiella variicola]
MKNLCTHMVKKCLRKKSPPQQVIQRIGALAPQDTVLVTGVGQHQVRASHFLPHDKPGSWLTSGGAGAMGYCISAALGAKTGRPEAIVWGIDGDGCFQLDQRELATVALNSAPAKNSAP